MEQKQPARRLRSLPDATGAQRRWEATFTPILDDAEQVTHVVEVWRDVTDRTQLEAQLSHSERLASLGMLAAGVGHEINNPLASVLAGVESLNRWLERADFSADGRSEANEVLAVLAREVHRCRETTDKLMLLARPFSIAPSWVTLNQVALDTVSLLRFQMRKQQVEVVETLDPDLPQIWARDTAMRAVCMNLMINALQAMPAGGTLTVSTARQDSTRVVLTVQDTGAGIAPEHVQRIWDPFFTTKPMGQGTGLGLSITQRIVARHGGDIQLENAPGGGARFIVVLPIGGSGGSGV
jgi:signal transduction histidine kinase